MKGQYFLGLDIGTNSLGYAVTDEKYQIQRAKGKAMWGAQVFEEANQAAERRMQRSARRRTARVKQRVKLIRELFAAGIGKVDEMFYQRLDESFLYAEDKTLDGTNSLFSDKEFTDAEYHKKYPTIHHLIMDLIDDPRPHDVRLVYLAVSYLVSHRGHFLYDVDKEEIDRLLSFDDVYQSFASCCMEESIWRAVDCEKMAEVLIQTRGINNTKNALTQVVFGNEKPEKYEAEIIKAMSGAEFKLSVLFEKEEYAQLEKNKISFKKSDVDDNIEMVLSEIGEDADILLALKGIHDWAALARMMNGGQEKYISRIKIQQYEKHKKDLAFLKKFIKKYLPEKYNEIFKIADDKTHNYTAYSKNIKSSKILKPGYQSATVEEFSDYLRKLLKGVTPEECDKEQYEQMMKELSEYTFMPKQKNTDNRLIPHQLFWYELKSILDNAKTYLDFLNSQEEDGISAAEKILSVFEFRIPYYVGPLGKYRNKNAWMIRKQEGRILPWNFSDMVDLDKSEEAFIRKMTNQCSYLAGEDVLAKNSLLYTKFMVLNEINKIKYDEKPISVAMKQKLYQDLFVDSKRKVSKKAILQWLAAQGIAAEAISGIDDTVKTTLKSYHVFQRMFAAKILSEKDAEDIIARMTITTDKKRLKKWLKTEYKQLSDSDIAYIAGQKFSDYGRLSKKLLDGIEAVHKETGELLTVIGAMWETNLNLMELMAAEVGYSALIEKANREYYSGHSLTLSERLDEMYVSNAVKRPIFRTLDVVKEIKHIQKGDPKKIFIEVTRKEGVKERTVSRKDQLMKKYRAITEPEYQEVRELLEKEEETRLKSKKLYLYYTQLGRCMYTGEPIRLELLMRDHSAYDIDHIYPQARVKDDSVDNMVLVKKEQNGRKSDTYPIAGEIRTKMYGFWKMLCDKGMITKEKLNRLARSTSFKDEELSGFINRQLVETSQAIKAVATVLSELCPDSEIVYVKARLASDFRHVFDFDKCRELNDLHHAKDAYLNIVMGNIYHVQFTQNPIHFIKEKEKNRNYTIKLTDKEGQGLLARDIERNGEIAWKGDGSFLALVKKTMVRNDINYVRYAFCRKGQLFNLTLQKAPRGENELVPIKKELDPAKYGGYNNTAAAFFAMVKHTVKKKEVLSILPVELIIADQFRQDDDFALRYLAKRYKLENPQFVFGRKILKINTMIEFENGFRANIASKSSGGAKMVLASAVPLLFSPEQEQYARKICSKITKAKEKRIPLAIYPQFDHITKEENAALYQTFVRKTKSHVFAAVSAFSNVGKLMEEKAEAFANMELEEQCQLIYSLLSLFKTGRTTGCDITSIDGSKNTGIITISSKINKNIRIIDQSPTGLLEKKSENLLTL
ncbi:type II CRISPR RNA-guided endonuclease Cas9 [Ructibacterium gallinarum]|uniref:CRISPR-associated endonuclease Cas9 n=1 Tax=Ructibacterium gallinarum TaxID=2779355 RepID=A0A9D5M6W9_9FIRM|nr:type II CRISPR RNA-guided endonuclease Cas9 [Ructibacterium gallinarum]MBE5040622.1 type II CRISPR RNA-guided endonuclease Cas9 [Ructibacterium gallinarum]